MSEARGKTTEVAVGPELTAFQQNILVILTEEAMYGLAIKRELEGYYATEVNHGRLYPNLDDLVEMGLVEKSELDKRTNQYALIDDGFDAVANRVEWIASKFVTDGDRADRLVNAIESKR